MIGLLTWSTYGAWLPGPGRGWIDPGAEHATEPLPEPDVRLAGARAGTIHRDPVRLSPEQRDRVLSHLEHMAGYRDYRPLAAVAAEDHVHVLLEADDDLDIPRLVQLVKGSLSRNLTCAGGDEPAPTPSGRVFPHRRWFSHQFSFRRVRGEDALAGVRRALLGHGGPDAAVRTWDRGRAGT